MRIVLFAWCPTTTAHLDALIAAGAPPALVVSGQADGEAAPAPAGAPAGDPGRLPQPPATAALERGCAAAGVRFVRCRDPNSDAVLAQLAQLAPDLLVVAGCPRVLGASVRGLFRVGAVNLHPSLLPAYRGREPLFWALLGGEATVGVTVHHLTGVLDAGPILLRREIPVPPRATGASLAVEIDRAGAALLPELLAMVRGGALPEGEPQRGAGSYFPPLREEHGRIAWTEPAAAIDRRVRACSGHIAAHTFFRGMKILVCEGEPAPSMRWSAGTARAPAPGEVLAVEDDALVVATGEGVFLVRGLVFLHRVRRPRDLSHELGILPGSRLTGGPG